MPEFELQSVLPFVPVVITAIGIIVAVLSPGWQRKKQRVEIAQAAFQVTGDAMELVASRLAIRFDPARLPTEGVSMRQLRTTACIETLGEFKVADLPPMMIGSFSAVRGGLGALNEAMSSELEGDWPPHPERLSYYRNVWNTTGGHFDALRLVAEKLKLTPPRLPRWSPRTEVSSDQTANSDVL